VKTWSVNRSLVYREKRLPYSRHLGELESRRGSSSTVLLSVVSEVKWKLDLRDSRSLLGRKKRVGKGSPFMTFRPRLQIGIFDPTSDSVFPTVSKVQ
jgi:hypothetical protein